MIVIIYYIILIVVTSRFVGSESLCTSQILVQRSLHAHCEDIIAPGTLGHIAQKTLHLAATNSTTGQHHNTNSFHTQHSGPRIPNKNMQKILGRVTLASRRPTRQSPNRALRNWPNRALR